MPEPLIELDRCLTLLINGAGSERWDGFMRFMSEKWVWMPLYIAIVSVIIRNFEQDFWIPLLFIAVLIALTDQTTSSLMKPYFARLRPCREEELAELIRLAGTCGGQYGFASSHAANTMGLAVFVSFIASKKMGYFLVVWSFIVGFSRICLGAHYAGDVLVGFIIGGIMAFALFKLMLLVFPKAGERISR